MIQPINNSNCKEGILAHQQKNQAQKPPAINGIFSVPETPFPQGGRNYCLFNQAKTEFIAAQKEHAIPYAKKVLLESDDEKEILETLYIVDKMVDNGTKGMHKLYPALSRHNDTKSPNVQVFLAGIYRKTQIPDAFGPLVAMLIKNSTKKEDAKMQNYKPSSSPYNPFNSSPVKPPFDPNEEIGGAILAYMENYSHNPSKIDYNA